MPSVPVSAPWTREDTEAVACCLCGRPGRPIYDLDPFGVVRCPACTLVFVSPRLRPEALQRLYDDSDYHDGVYGDGNSGAMFLQRQWTAGRLALAAREAPVREAPVREAPVREAPVREAPVREAPVRAGRLLEIGAGHGLFLDAARRRGYDVTGVELSVTAAAHARDTLGLDVHSTQLADAPLDGRFDVVCAWDTLEHVPDPVEFWRTVRGLLADDGVVLFSTPYFSSLPSRVLRERWWTLKPTEHIYAFTPRTHRAVAEAAGLRVTRLVRSPLARANLGRLDSLVGVARR